MEVTKKSPLLKWFPIEKIVVNHGKLNWSFYVINFWDSGNLGGCPTCSGILSSSKKYKQNIPKFITFPEYTILLEESVALVFISSKHETEFEK